MNGFGTQGSFRSNAAMMWETTRASAAPQRSSCTRPRATSRLLGLGSLGATPDEAFLVEEELVVQRRRKFFARTGDDPLAVGEQSGGAPLNARRGIVQSDEL